MSDEATMRVMTFNIHHGEGVDGRLDLTRIAEVIRAQQCDVVGLQEVDRHFGQRSALADQASWLARALRMQATYGPAMHIGRREYGNAVLTALPVSSREWSALPVPAGVEPRGMVRITLESGVRCWVTHLTNDDADARRVQVEAIRTRLQARPGPTILLGDFNARPADPALAPLKDDFVDAWAAVHGDGGATFPSGEPRRRIDYVLTTPDLRPVEARVVDVGPASDHRAVVAVVRAANAPS